MSDSVRRRHRAGQSALLRTRSGHFEAEDDADMSERDVYGVWLKRLGCEQLSLRRRPFLRPFLTWMASISPRLTRCHTVCRETPSRRMVWYMVRYPSGASSATRLRKSSVRRIRHGAPGVSCSPAM